MYIYIYIYIKLQKWYILEIVSGRDLTTITTTITTAAGQGGFENWESTNEARTHSCALLRRPKSLS